MLLAEMLEEEVEDCLLMERVTVFEADCSRRWAKVRGSLSEEILM